jgi:spermidine synthase/Tfp pilus assembly protein PilF
MTVEFPVSSNAEKYMPIIRKHGRYLRLAALLTVFLSNGAIMTVELVAGRVVSPHLGMSLYTWTSIIGIVMAGMSLGNYFGGRLADHRRTRKTLAWLFIVSALACASTLLTNEFFGGLAAFRALAWPLRIFLHTLLVFVGPAILLGAISPVVAKMALYGGGDSGRVMGGIFAAGVAGSILGTFATGFYLVAWFPVPYIVLGSSIILGVTGLLYLLSALIRTEPAPTAMVSSQPEASANTGWTFREWFVPNATVFASNAAFMVIEIAAMRIIAREFGASLYTWTSVIGIVLAGITFGNYFGGRLSVRASSGRVIMTLFVLASLFALASPLLSRFAAAATANSFSLMILSWPQQITLHTVFAFFLPNLFIGMISPVVVKRALDQGHGAGRTVGNIYAWGAVGSITATFLTGYLLIDWLGPHALIVISAAFLALVGLLYRPQSSVAWAWAVIALLALAAVYAPNAALQRTAERLAFRPAAGSNVIYEDESQYSYIAVLEDPANPRIREMRLDKLTHSQINLDDPTDLRYEYEIIYEAVIDRVWPPPAPLRTLIIGGGGFAFPHHLEISRPGSYIETAEIDPAVTEAAFAAFGLPRDTSIQIFNQDARNRVADLARTEKADPGFEKFDCIFGDSINDYTVPYHLTTLEFAQQIHGLLNEEGMYLLNLIDMYSSGRFAGAIVNTLSQVFSDVHVFSSGRTPTVRDTFVIVCGKMPRDLRNLPIPYPRLGDSIVLELKEKSRGIILSDDYAPVENLLAPVVRTQGGRIGEMRLERARELAAAGETAEAIEQARMALDVHPIWPEGWEFLSGLLQQQEDREGAIAALENALRGHTNAAQGHSQLGQALFGAQRYDEAIQQWRLAAERDPQNVLHVYNQGLAHAAKNDLPAAIATWQAALAIAPGHPDTLHNLSLAYLISQQYDLAWQTVDAIRSAGGVPDPQVLLNLQAAAPRAP